MDAPVSPRQTKQLLRRLAASLARGLLRCTSRHYESPDGPTVVLAPHQDDETLGCGGLIARKRNDGLPVHVIFITDGAASHPGHARLTPRDLAALRREEARQAMTWLGVERPAIHFLDEPDGTLKDIDPLRREQLVERLSALLIEIAPGEIFLPCAADGSSEHDAVFEFALDAIARASVRPALWQYPVWSWGNPRLLFRCWLETSDCRRQPLEDYWSAKHRAIAAYQSQIAPLAPDPAPALPAELVARFLDEAEYVFRYDPPHPGGPAI